MSAESEAIMDAGKTPDFKPYKTSQTPSATADKGAERPKVKAGIAHTPGPWRFQNDSFQNGECSFRILADQINSSTLIATVHVFHDPYKGEEAANARLIAASPETAAERDKLREQVKELLAACKAALAHESCFNECDEQDVPKRVMQLRVAIRHAEGGQ